MFCFAKHTTGYSVLDAVGVLSVECSDGGREGETCRSLTFTQCCSVLSGHENWGVGLGEWFCGFTARYNNSPLPLQLAKAAAFFKSAAALLAISLGQL